jgi:putative ABC transport system permease protein
MGLTAAFTVFSTVAIQCWYDFSYNRNLKGVDNVYMYAQEYNQFFASRLEIRNKEIETLKQTYPEIVDICAFLDWTSWNVNYLYCDVISKDGTETRYRDNTRYGITDGFLSIFNIRTVAGDATRLFDEPDKAILTESYAKKFFGNENPVGKVIKAGNLHRDQIYGIPQLTVVAVWEDFPDNCSLKNGLYYDIGNDPHGDQCNSVYTKINKSNTEMLAKRMGHGEHLPKERIERSPDYFNSRNGSLIPFHKIHFSKMGKGNLVTTLSMLSVGILALLIAWINFMNFSIAVAPARVKSLNIQKIFGARNGMLRLVTASESAVFSLTAFLFSIICVAILYDGLPNDLFVAGLFNSRQTLSVIGIFVVLSGFCIGLYPAYYVTSFKPLMTLSGSPAKSKKNVHLRNILTSMQFTICIALITVVIFMKMQHNYVVNYSYNMSTENIIFLSTKEWEDGNMQNPELVQAFAEELKKSPQISDYATTRDFIGGSFTNNDIKINDVTVVYHDYCIGSNFLKILDIPMIAGVNFDDYTSSYDPSIVNKEFIKACGMSESDIIGLPFDGDGARGTVIIGVIDNINFDDLHNTVCPLIFTLEDPWRKPPDWLLIKLTNRDEQTIAYIKSVWKNFSKKPFEYTFLDDYLASLYKRENDQANLLTIICIITIIIAIMGVFGLIIFNIRQKEKEIALRKIAGATVWNILLLLNRGALIQLLIAFVIAAPAAYYITNRWLETFAYKISMHWWVFVLCWLCMCLIVTVTISLQTYRAATKNPVDAIKSE